MQIVIHPPDASGFNGYETVKSSKYKEGKCEAIVVLNLCREEIEKLRKGEDVARKI